MFKHLSFVLLFLCSIAIASPSKVLQEVRSAGITCVDITFSDILGNLKEITVPISKAEAAIKSGLFFDGSSILGFSSINKSDLLIKADVNTFIISPWKTNEGKTARFMANVCESDSTPYPNDPRSLLQKTVERATLQGYTCYCGAELEFFLFKRNRFGLLEPFDTNGYCSAETNLDHKSFKESLMNIFTELDINPEKIHHEVARGQLEIVLRYTDALTMADRILLAKHTIQSFALQNGFVASFMPKPIEGINGSGMHVHFSLFNNEKQCNAFYDSNEKTHLSSIARSFIAGLLDHFREIGALLNPVVNSYKRLVPGYEAPVYLCWGEKNRSAAIRIPDIISEELESLNGAPVRIEIRSIDASCNPYLAFAALIESGLDGVAKKLVAPAPAEYNLYHITKEERSALKIKTIPCSLKEALDIFSESTFAKKILGESLHKTYVEIKYREWQSYLASVKEDSVKVISSWEKEYQQTV